MALTVSQLAAVSYPAVLKEMRSMDQFSENAALREFDRQGFIDREDFGENIEVPLDYRANPDTAILVGDQDTAALIKTEIMTSAVYDIAQLNVPVTWTKGDEMKNTSATQKVDLVKRLLVNGINSHDNQLETNIFTTSAAGGVEINGLDTIANSTDGTGTVGGIISGTETWWKNKFDSFVDGSDIEAAMTELFNNCAKGSGSPIQPKLLVSGAASHALYESQLQTLQRFVDSKEADAGFKVLAFKTARYIFSHKGGSTIYFLNPESYKMVVSREYFRDKGDTFPVPGQNASYFLIYSGLQFIVSNRSRIGALAQS